jgi:hypothetical protein
LESFTLRTISGTHAFHVIASFAELFPERVLYLIVECIQIALGLRINRSALAVVKVSVSTHSRDAQANAH